MRGLGGVLRRVAAEVVGLVADDWRAPLGIGAILGAGWWLIARGAGSAGAPALVAALATFLLASTVLDGRARLRRRRADSGIDSTRGGRVPDRDS